MTKTILILTSIIVVAFVLGYSIQDVNAVPTETIVNGDFETGTFAGWTKVLIAGGNTGWVANNGLFDPNGPSVRIAPISGNFDAVNFQTTSGEQILKQSFTVPTNIITAQLTWDDRIRSHTFLTDPRQEARVQIRDSAGTTVLATVFSTNAGDPSIQIGPNARSFDITSILQTLEGQTVTLVFDNEIQIFFMNWNIDNVSLLIENAIPVEVDFKPGSDPSSVDCLETKPVPVAVLSSEDLNFEESLIDLGSLQLNGVDVTEIHNKVHLEDKNNDGIKDAVLHLDRSQVCEATKNTFLKASINAFLTGSFTTGGGFEGTSDIRIVGPEINPVKGEFCHLGETRSGSPDAVAEHLSHGDTIGACP